MTKEKVICSRCIYDNVNVPDIVFDEEGVCNYCRTMEKLIEQYGTGSEKGEAKLNEILEQIREEGKDKKYDCVVGVSGGTDSSYMLMKAIEWGLKPLAVHYDNTWNTSAATENIRKITTKLNVDLYTHVVDNKEVDDIFRSFFKAGVIEIDCSTDMGLAETLYRAASKFKVRYILEGHSFVAEGISPIGRGYQDGGYVKSVHKTYGKLPLKTYPLMSFTQFMKWVLFYRIKKVRPLWYIDYSKEEARKILEEKFDWEYYGGHHLENRMSAFAHSIYRPQKFNNDQRNNSLSASVRNGILDREEAIEIYNSPPKVEKGIVDYFKKRLKLTDEEYDGIMKGEKRSFLDFNTYKKRFEKMEPIFKYLAKHNYVPMSFYLKYCFPLPEGNYDKNN